MASDILIVVSGTASTEQDFVKSMEAITTQVFGWEMVGRPTDTASNRDYWFASEGETPGQYQRLYCSLQGSSDKVQVEAATYTVSGTIINDLITTASGYVNWPNQRQFWAVGNKDVVYFFSKDSSNANYTGGFGYLDTYYPTYADDPNPVFVLSQAQTYHKFSTDERVQAYLADNRAIAHGGGVAGGGFLDATVASGTFGSLIGPEWSDLLRLNAPSLRDNMYAAFRVPLWKPREVSLFNPEVRGELPYTWQVWGDNTVMGNVVLGSGILFDTDTITDSSTFLVTSQSGVSDNSYLIGPIEHFDLTNQAVPYSHSGLVLYLDGSRGLERNGGVFYGGRVKRWTDYSVHPALTTSDGNNAIQHVLANMPEPSNNIVNGNNVIRFKSAGSTTLSGSLPINNDITIFTVANYVSGASRTPVINIRGDVASQDTLFAVEFNQNSNNSATIINTAAGGSDVAEYTGLSAGNYYLVTNTVSGTTSSIFLNGSLGVLVDDAKGTVGGSGTLKYSIGRTMNSGGTPGSVYADGTVAEVIVYNRYLTEQERQEIHCMLAEKYNLAVGGC